MKDGVEISIFQMKHYEDAYKLWLDVFPISTDASYNRINIEYFLTRNPKTSFVAALNGKVIGTVLAGNDGRRGYIHHLGLLPGYRGRGWGKKLLHAAEAALRKCGMTKVHLFVYKEDVAAKRFYDKAGYQERQDIDIHSRNIGL